MSQFRALKTTVNNLLNNLKRVNHQYENLLGRDDTYRAICQFSKETQSLLNWTEEQENAPDSCYQPTLERKVQEINLVTTVLKSCFSSIHATQLTVESLGFPYPVAAKTNRYEFPKGFNEYAYTPALLVEYVGDGEKNNPHIPGKPGICLFTGFVSYAEAVSWGEKWQDFYGDNPCWNSFWIKRIHEGFTILKPRHNPFEKYTSATTDRTKGHFFRYLTRELNSNGSIVKSLELIGPFKTESNLCAYAGSVASYTDNIEWQSIGLINPYNDPIVRDLTGFTQEEIRTAIFGTSKTK